MIDDTAAREKAREAACCPEGCRKVVAELAFCYSKFETGVDAIIDAYLSALPEAGTGEWEPPAGWKLVPIEPTETMLAAGWGENIGPVSTRPTFIYRAMVVAAPALTREALRALTEETK